MPCTRQTSEMSSLFLCRLYHKMDVRERAIQKHGSIEAMLAVMMPEVQV